MTHTWIVSGQGTAPDVLWRLLDWCAARGADEFTLEIMALADTPAAVADAFEDALGAAELPPAVRPVLDGRAGPEFPSRVRRWRLDGRTLRLLRGFLPGGPLDRVAHGPGEAGWFENLTLYRGGRIVFAALTHDGVGVLRATAAERAEPAAPDVALHPVSGG